MGLARILLCYWVMTRREQAAAKRKAEGIPVPCPCEDKFGRSPPLNPLPRVDTEPTEHYRKCSRCRTEWRITCTPDDGRFTITYKDVSYKETD